MSNRYLLSLIFLLLLSNLSVGQKIIKGKTLHKNSKEPIPYVNIGVEKSNIGTISNADGSFLIVIPQNLSLDTLTFSALGFVKRRIPIKLLAHQKDINILLNEKSTLLNSVTVSATKQKNKKFELGNKTSNGGTYEPDTTYAGRCIALLIENKQAYIEKGLDFPAFLEKVSLRIFRNNLKSFKFRIRLNAVDSLTGQPSEDLLQQSIIVESSMKNGWLTFDLSHLNYLITKPFFVSFEQILDLHDRTAIADGYRTFMQKYPERLKTDTVEFEGKKVVRQKIIRGGIDLPGTFIGISTSNSNGYTCFARETSLGEWKKVRGIVTAYITVGNQLISTEAIKTSIEIPCKDAIECLIEKNCKDFIDESGMNGLQVCVSKGNKIKYSINLGYADVANNIPVTDSTRFRINSISKAMTSLALVKLISEKKLDLDAPVQQYLPDFPPKKYTITTRQLAGHLAGFRDYKEDDLNDYIRTEHFDNAIQALKVFKDDTLLFKPNTQFHYSSFGWNLIGAVIEGASKESYLQYMRKNIWHPLKLSSTCGDDIKSTINNRSKFYDVTGQENDLGDLSYKYSGGGLLSTAKDLVTLGNEILHGNYFDPTLKKALFESQYTTDKQATGYGIGWYTGKDKNGHRIWYHAGDSFSSSSYLIIYPDDDIVIAFLGNSQEGVMFNVQNIGELIYGK
ncbi:MULTISPECIES: serine hydrolase [unclassified Arcicella]|uniref:serine hydrolase n=1 Tax=unclassified Arcicella TaxID=2644986 RepID=UPI00285F98E2|nr:MULTISPECIES: serine hydrolase [unclassified Arcicella]MDR6560603.1 CubicO group peptidase (beta-lactamase class C family) [Arcicella sp. BE51]MDR6810487.1 CubicO group peptidase (beta-lactamase class C family) [Arcicella sp. BE140]MDR6821837.1 CubicO group peptidase (beta-lactamase class C family) [Arcicella sp. BE139]